LSISTIRIADISNQLLISTIRVVDIGNALLISANNRRYQQFDIDNCY